MKQSANLRRLIVEFIHPGQEFLPPARSTKDRVIWDDDRRLSGIRSWNNEKHHKRKFLISNGMYRTSPDGMDVSGRLTLWGEWEPQSQFRKLFDPPPSYVHDPLLEECSTGRHNTDPFVFGREFWFTTATKRDTGF